MSARSNGQKREQLTRARRRKEQLFRVGEIGVAAECGISTRAERNIGAERYLVSPLVRAIAGARRTCLSRATVLGSSVGGGWSG